MNFTNNPYKTMYVEKRIDTMEKRLDKIEKDIEKILFILEKVEPNCEKMSTHIDFVDKVYETVKSPLEYICNGVKRLSENNNIIVNKKNLISYKDL